jgi:hypothetical protein
LFSIYDFTIRKKKEKDYNRIFKVRDRTLFIDLNLMETMFQLENNLVMYGKTIESLGRTLYG